MKDFVEKDFAKDEAAIAIARTSDLNSFDTSLLLFLPMSANVDAPLAVERPQTDPNRGPALARLPLHGWYRKFGKRMFDMAFVIATLPISLPIVLFCALALWIESGSPFYRQDRLGRGGKVFSLLKLRTMVHGADAHLDEILKNDPQLRHEWETTQKLKKDPRITRVGAFLRATSMDELPQLWNVFRGEMSLVGPRPMMPEQLPLYGDARAYLALKPGLTGAWQVSARNENLFAYRAKMDAGYFANVTMWGDLVLLFKTIGVVVRRTGY